MKMKGESMTVTGIINIFGIDNEIAKILKKKNITTVKRLYDATRTADTRKQLATESGIPEQHINYWAKQAELLRIDNVSPENAVELIFSGISCIEDIISKDTGMIMNCLLTSNPDTLITQDQISNWKSGKIRMAKPFEIPERENTNNLFLKDNVNTENVKERYTEQIYSDLSDIICEIGTGIAEAQKNMDLASMEVQNSIFEDEQLSAYGLNATWYAIPEATFELKMEYKFEESQTVSASFGDNKLKEKAVPVKKKRIRVMPSNASYNNLFQTSGSSESILKLKFMPIPVSERLTERVTMPDLIGLTYEDGKKMLDRLSIVPDVIYGENCSETDKNLYIARQTPQAGGLVALRIKPVIFLGKDI